MLNEAWITIFGNNGLAVTADEIQIRPGLGRHQLVIPLQVRPTSEAAVNHDYSFSGLVSASGLRSSGGYLGRLHATMPRRLSANSLINEYPFLDIDPAQIATIESRREGGFMLDMQIEVEADGGSERGATQLNNHPVSRETWLRILEQVKYRRTLLIELRLTDSPALGKAGEHFANAQRRFLEGENRLAVEGLRQALAALVGMDAKDEEDVDTITADSKAVRNGQQGYGERIELVRRSLKLLADLGAHPDVDETGPTEARAAIAMVGGLLQWYGMRPS